MDEHLRIKRFFGTSENAVKCQVWIAVANCPKAYFDLRAYAAGVYRILDRLARQHVLVMHAWRLERVGKRFACCAAHRVAGVK